MRRSGNETVTYISEVIKEAKRRRASDIHFEPGEERFTVRLRIDGLLHPYDERGLSLYPSIVSRFKVLAGMDIGEKRVPQDGGLTYVIDDETIDIRISTLPTIHGEKIALRMLDKNMTVRRLADLGLTERGQREVRKWLRQLNGLILATGPTGSGKTSTLYTLLHELRHKPVNIVTLEDPVELKLAQVNQVQVNQKAGLTFASGLRAILRQDPDVIMVGEIRDRETAEIAVRAALTGHLVLSSLHTRDTASAITRLLDMGVEPYLIASALTGVIAQRLIRILCPECGGIAAKDCGLCYGIGYYGRQGVFEVFTIDEEIGQTISRCPSAGEIRARQKEKGMETLSDLIMEKVNARITTIEEYHRVVMFDAD
ncbi:GspE/PulE family protein [Bacillaceae bacterium]